MTNKTILAAMFFGNMTWRKKCFSIKGWVEEERRREGMPEGEKNPEGEGGREAEVGR